MTWCHKGTKALLHSVMTTFCDEFNGLVQDCGNSIANSMGCCFLQSCPTGNKMVAAQLFWFYHLPWTTNCGGIVGRHACVACEVWRRADNWGVTQWHAWMTTCHDWWGKGLMSPHIDSGHAADTKYHHSSDQLTSHPLPEGIIVTGNSSSSGS